MKALRKENKKYIWAACLCFMIIGLVIFMGIWQPLHDPEISRLENSTVDLQGIDFDTGKPIILKGQWEFFWQKLLVTDHLENQEPDGLIPVPSYWIQLEQDGHALPNHGYASYRIRLVNCPPEADVLVVIPNLPSAYRVFLNGQPVSGSGTVLKNPENTEVFPSYIEMNTLPLRSSECELVIEVSSHVYPGLCLTPILIDRSTYEQAAERDIIFSSLLLGIAIVFIIFYAMDRMLKPKSGYSVTILLVMILFLLKSFYRGPIFSAFCFWSPIPYDYMLFPFHAAGVAAWGILLCANPKPSGVPRSKKRIVCVNLLVLGAYAIAVGIGLAFHITWWWALVDILLAPILFVGMVKPILQDEHAPSPYFFPYYLGCLCVYAGCLLGDMALGGLFPFDDSFAFQIGLVCLTIAIKYVDGKRLNAIQNEALKVAEMRAELQRAQTNLALHQIQPHFLYNALLAIKVLCRKDPEKAEKAVYDFSTYLRGNMDSIESTEPILFEEELQNIRAYLKIEQMRFGERLHVILDIQCRNFMVPPLTVQPLVENAVRHGICKKIEGGTVSLCSYQKDGFVWIEILDDGVGFDVEQLQSSSFGGVGIKNLRYRLETLLKAKLEIQSEVGEGTKQVIQIPEQEAQLFDEDDDR